MYQVGGNPTRDLARRISRANSRDAGERIDREDTGYLFREARRNFRDRVLEMFFIRSLDPFVYGIARDVKGIRFADEREYHG